MIDQKSFEYIGFKYLMVAVQFEHNVVIRLSADDNFLYDCDMSNETYAYGISAGHNLIDEVFNIVEATVKGIPKHS